MHDHGECHGFDDWYQRVLEPTWKRKGGREGVRGERTILPSSIKRHGSPINRRWNGLPFNKDRSPFCFQTEIAKRLNAIIAQILPFLSQEHQQQVATAVDRAKQVTMTELNAIIGVSARQWKINYPLWWTRICVCVHTYRRLEFNRTRENFRRGRTGREGDMGISNSKPMKGCL